MSEITVFSAKKIITMDPNRPEATHVAVRAGHILAVGDKACANQWGEVIHDDSLSHAVLMPGLIEGHAHMMAGAMWEHAYAGFHDRMDPKGKWWCGKPDVATVVRDLIAFGKDLPDGAPLLGWGLDPIFFEGERISRKHLDQVSRDRPVAIMFSNFHLMCVNTKALELAGYDHTTNVEGVVKDADGDLTGELQEMAAMFPVMRRVGMDFRGLTQKPDAVRSYGEVCMRAGVTTTTDLYAQMEGKDLDALLAVTSEHSFLTRLVSVMGVAGSDPVQSAAIAREIRDKSTSKLRLGAVKLMTDGSIQGWTARVKSPGYLGGHPNGIWNMAPAEIHRMVAEMQKAGVQMHIHVNGDEASAVAIDALHAAARAHPWPDARHVLQHCQMMGRDQFERCVPLGICCNIFSNHIWYFGDQHVALTVGEDRARRMNAVRSALETGVHVAIHSDAPVTPLGPLFTAWAAVNRQTMSGRVLGAAQCITVPEALHAITMGAAYTLKMDHEIGSIETGKRADFAILGDDPLSVDPGMLKDVPVLGTVLGGRTTFA